MKGIKISLLGIAFLGLSLGTKAQEYCDTLKLKTIKTYYGEVIGSYFNRIGELNDAVINVDSLTKLFPEMLVKNISNDTFSSDVKYENLIIFFLYDDKDSLLVEDHNVSLRLPILKECLPNDTITFASMAFPLPEVIKEIEGMGINFDQISYWKMITGISYTSRDGTYSDSVFYAGADTVTFRIVRGGVGIAETDNYPSLRVYPNPAKNQLIIECRDGACPVPTGEYTIYSVVGQVVMQGETANNTPLAPLKGGIDGVEENSPFKGGRGMSEITIDVSHLAKGMYFLKIGNQTTKFIKE